MKTIIMVLILFFSTISQAETHILFDAVSMSKEDVDLRRYEKTSFVKNILHGIEPDYNCHIEKGMICSNDIIILEFKKNNKEYRFWTVNVKLAEHYIYDESKLLTGVIIEYDDTKQIISENNILFLNDNSNEVYKNGVVYKTDEEFADATRKLLKKIGKEK